MIWLHGRGIVRVAVKHRSKTGCAVVFVCSTSRRIRSPIHMMPLPAPSSPFPVKARPPNLIGQHSSYSVNFTSRDFYSNEITTGYGNDAFSAWIYQPTSTGANSENSSQQAVMDNGDGSYVVQTRPNEVPGTVLLFVQRNGDNIPGSPFEVIGVGGRGQGT